MSQKILTFIKSVGNEMTLLLQIRTSKLKHVSSDKPKHTECKIQNDNVCLYINNFKGIFKQEVQREMKIAQR